MRKDVHYLRCADAAPYINASSHCQKRKIHLGLHNLIEGSRHLKCEQILDMAEKETYLALWRPESQIFSSTSNAVPFCGSYWNYTFI